jgi:DNA invertase Pin-like site-specific DNA recombinase
MFQEIPRNYRYGYKRVSSKLQEDNSFLEFEKQEFMKLAVSEKNIWIEIGSVTDPIRERPVLQKLIEK